MKSWMDALARTRNAIVSRVSRLFEPSEPRAEEKTAEQWEEALIAADVPARLAAEWVGAARHLGGGGPLEQRLERVLVQALEPVRHYEWDGAAKPTVVLIVGVNGSGKTTTAAKLASFARARGRVPLLAATDTFRAAGTEQLRIWADRVPCDVVAGRQGADAAAVAYDAVQAAVARGADAVFIDTAGRMHTKQHLMVELQKVKRSIAKCLPGAPHEIWLVVDATIGNNAVMQAQTFNEAVGLTGLVVAKLDGSAKAGSMLAARREVGVPIVFVGLGETLDDLAPFEARPFVCALLGIQG